MKGGGWQLPFYKATERWQIGFPTTSHSVFLLQSTLREASVAATSTRDVLIWRQTCDWCTTSHLYCMFCLYLDFFDYLWRGGGCLWSAALERMRHFPRLRKPWSPKILCRWQRKCVKDIFQCSVYQMYNHNCWEQRVLVVLTTLKSWTEMEKWSIGCHACSSRMEWLGAPLPVQRGRFWSALLRTCDSVCQQSDLGFINC